MRDLINDFCQAVAGIFQRFNDWLIKFLGGYTIDKHFEELKANDALWEACVEKANKAVSVAEQGKGEALELAKKYASDFQHMANKYAELERSFCSVGSHIDISKALGYTENNVIQQSKAQAYYQLGKAVYPYATHSVVDGKYVFTVTVKESSHLNV